MGAIGVAGRPIVGGVVAAVCAVPLIWAGLAYPLPVWPLAAVLTVYAAALWRWPFLFLLVVPAVLPALDLSIWTGWSMVGEADLFVLVSVGVLAIRDPPSWRDVLPRGAGGAILAVFALVYGIAALIGLYGGAATPLSGNPYLRPDNALRLIKPLGGILILLPFLRHRQRVHGDMAGWLGWGMTVGATLVALQVLLERTAFPGLFDFRSDYRVVAAFQSMHIGGGHIGAYFALVLPFLLGCALGARRWFTGVLLLAPAAAIAYALAVTFARTAYAATALGLLTGLFAWLALRPRGTGGVLRRFSQVLLVAPVLGGLGLAASSEMMRDRFDQSSSDLLTRESNWRNGWSLHDGDVVHFAFGMGLGTYPRLSLEQSVAGRPGDFRLVGSGENRYLTISGVSPVYFGQKILLHPGEPLRLMFRWRASAENAVAGIVLCEKLLLYSENCRGQNIPSRVPGSWEAVSTQIPSDGLGGRTSMGLSMRPIEFAVFNATPGTSVAFHGLSLTTARGEELLVNGDFRDGLARWNFTNDDHLVWRMKNLWLMLLFETGVLGVLGFLALCAGTVAGGAWAVRGGGRTGTTRPPTRRLGRAPPDEPTMPPEPMGAAAIGAVCAFAISGLFDNLLEAPRVAAVFFLVCACALTLWGRSGHAEGASRAGDGSLARPLPAGPARVDGGTPLGEVETY